jgi:hypothetical protein
MLLVNLGWLLVGFISEKTDGATRKMLIRKMLNIIFKIQKKKDGRTLEQLVNFIRRIGFLLKLLSG